MSLPWRRLAALILLAAIAAAASPAWAGHDSEEEGRRIRAVIRAQLDAFQQDDADAAFRTATPGVQHAIGHAGRFLAMVRGIYPMVYRPRAVDFLEVELKPHEALQLVRMVDAEDKAWLVLFILERQPDGSWLVGACSVNETSWKPT